MTQETVIEALLFPDKIEIDKSPPIAQKGISERKVLRVVYIELGGLTQINVFYRDRAVQSLPVGCPVHLENHPQSRKS